MKPVEEETIEKEYATLMAELGSKNAGVEVPVSNISHSATPWALGGVAGGAAPWQAGAATMLTDVPWAQPVEENVNQPAPPSPQE